MPSVQQAATPRPTPLIARLAAQIAELIRHDGAVAGTRLAERRLAEQLRVSRSPVRSALRLLEGEGVVAPADSGGFLVAEPPADQPAPAGPAAADDDLYLRMADDRLQGRLPDRITENEVMRRYALSRAEVARVLRRIAAEGWIERLPGHGWAFLPMLTSLQSYRDSYSFRLAIEPAAILADGFVLDRAAVERCRDEQRRLVDGAIWSISTAALFDLNSRLHETIIECSRNAFFIESLRRVDRLRRLIEYRQSLDRPHAILRCREHVRLADLLLAGEREAASRLMHRHLSSVGREKTLPRPAA